MSILSKQNPTDRFLEIIKQGLCISCGLCQPVAGTQNIRIEKVANGFLRPVVVGELTDALVDKIYDICPGTKVEGLPEAAISNNAKHDDVWGVWHRMVRGYAGDADVRHQGSTGGVLSALASFLLATHKVDFILHAKAGVKYPSLGEPHISRTHEEVMAGSGSRYAPTPTLINIDEVLAQNQPFAFIGTPCDIGALRNYARHDERVDRLVKYFLTPVCGGFMAPDKFDAMLRRNDIVPDEVTKLRYRGFGCPGPTRIETETEIKELHYLDMWGTDESQWGLPLRCKICPDGIGDSADIAAADTWAGGSPARDDGGDKGTNVIITRTQAGDDLLSQAIEAGAIAIEHDVPPDIVSHYQPHQTNKKYAVWGRYQGLKQMGRIAPETARLRIETLAKQLPQSHSDFQAAGMIARTKQGKHDE